MDNLKDAAANGGSPQQGPQPKYVSTADPVGEAFADGVFGVTLRNGIAKIELYSVIGLDDQSKTEVRRVSHRLILPMAGLNELAVIMQRMAKAIRQAQQQQQAGADAAGVNPITM